ncbi:Uncharacterized protein APZ42_018290 [Daphnia magna]|uniref:Uncharacterized protein n=1 Tax=Daphnia magna TaxID=35525 RepID=A0A164Z7J8_9CRUS|nr:Uncharacterized protein APZ42_018290 [Daphnia magna]
MSSTLHTRHTHLKQTKKKSTRGEVRTCLKRRDRERNKNKKGERERDGRDRLFR